MAVSVGAVAFYLASSEQMWEGRTTVMEKAVYERGVPVYPTTVVQNLNPEMHLADLATVASSVTVRERAVSYLSDLGYTLDPQTLLEHMRVQPIMGTGVLEITVTSRDQNEAVEAARAIQQEFVRFYRDLIRGPAAQSRAFIEKQLKDAELDLMKARQAKMAFEASNALPRPDVQAQVLIQRSADVDYLVAQAEADAGASAQRLNAIDDQIKREPTMKIASENITDNPVYMDLLRQKAAAEAALATQLATRGKNHPDVVVAQKNLDAINDEIAKQVPKIVSQQVKSENQIWTRAMIDRLSTKADQVGALARRNALAAELARKQSQIASLPDQQMKWAQLQLDVDSAEATVRLLKQKLDEAKIKEREAENASAIQVVDEARVFPVPKKAPLKIGVAALLSLLFGTSLAFLLNYLDTSVKSPAEVEDLLGLPVMAVVPLGRVHSLAKKPDHPALLASHEMVAATLAGFEGDAHSTILVASGEPQMGRSTTASNLAIALARDGGRVILVDADMRKPEQHRLFGVENKVGLSNLLSGTAQLEDTLVPTKVEGLLLLPAGPMPDNPIRLLRSKAMEKFVEDVSAFADFVIFDSPAGVVFPDAAVIAAYVKNVVIAHMSGKTPRGAESEFRSKLDVVGANVIGVVLNRARPEDCNGFVHYREYYEDLSGKGKRKPAIPAGTGE